MRFAGPATVRWSPPSRFGRRRRSRNRRDEALDMLHELALLETVRDAVARHETPSPATWTDTVRSVASRVPFGDFATLGSELSVRSTNSWFSAMSGRSIGSVFSFGSLLSAGSAGSVGSVGSVLSIGSAGSVLCIGSSGSVLSIGASGGLLTIGGRHTSEAGEGAPVGAGPDAATVRRISGLLAFAAIVAAPFDRRRVA